MCLEFEGDAADNGQHEVELLKHAIMEQDKKRNKNKCWKFKIERYQTQRNLRLFNTWNSIRYGYIKTVKQAEERNFCLKHKTSNSNKLCNHLRSIRVVNSGWRPSGITSVGLTIRPTKRFCGVNPRWRSSYFTLFNPCRSLEYDSQYYYVWFILFAEILPEFIASGPSTLDYNILLYSGRVLKLKCV